MKIQHVMNILMVCYRFMCFCDVVLCVFCIFCFCFFFFFSVMTAYMGYEDICVPLRMGTMVMIKSDYTNSEWYVSGGEYDIINEIWNVYINKRDKCNAQITIGNDKIKCGFQYTWDDMQDQWILYSNYNKYDSISFIPQFDGSHGVSNGDSVNETRAEKDRKRKILYNNNLGMKLLKLSNCDCNEITMNKITQIINQIKETGIDYSGYKAHKRFDDNGFAIEASK